MLNAQIDGLPINELRLRVYLIEHKTAQGVVLNVGVALQVLSYAWKSVPKSFTVLKRPF